MEVFLVFFVFNVLWNMYEGCFLNNYRNKQQFKASPYAKPIAKPWKNNVFLNSRTSESPLVKNNMVG